MRKIRTVNGEIFEVGVNGVREIVFIDNRDNQHLYGYYYVGFRDKHYALINPEHIVEFWPITAPELEHTP